MLTRHSRGPFPSRAGLRAAGTGSLYRTSGPRLPEDFSSERAQLIRLAQAATEHFNEAVASYNEAIGQFPALLLARLFGFQSARGVLVRP